MGCVKLLIDDLVELSELMIRTLFCAFLQDVSTDAGSSSAPPTVDMSALARVNEAGAKTINYLRTQLASLEQKLKHVQGVADVAVSKRKLAAEREDYLIEELGKTSKDLLCKWKPPESCLQPIFES